MHTQALVHTYMHNEIRRYTEERGCGGGLKIQRLHSPFPPANGDRRETVKTRNPIRIKPMKCETVEKLDPAAEMLDPILAAPQNREAERRLKRLSSKGKREGGRAGGQAGASERARARARARMRGGG